MVAPPSDPAATADLGHSEAGGARRLLLDELLAERERPPLPPAPVLSVEPAAVDATPIGAGRRAARKRLAEVEALARRNLRAAEEARRVMRQERQLLEEEASARTHAERTAATLRRELERLRSTEDQRAAQARFAATHEARAMLATEIEHVHDEHTRVVGELDRLRGTLFDHDSLLDEYSQRLHEEQQAQATARAELVRAEEARRQVERNLEIATETARRRSQDELARLTKTEEELHDTRVERDRATAELGALTTGDGELARLRAAAEATHEDMTRLLADLDVQAARADRAEAELTATREACEQAERTAADAAGARDLAGISLETTRSELAERSEALDAERAMAQSRVADLSAQLATTTRAAESATAQLADFEARLDAAVGARDDALARAVDLATQLERSTSDSEQLRTHAASIGDELAATHLALEDARNQVVRLETAAVETANSALREIALDRPLPPPLDASAAVYEPAPSAAPSPSPFDAALATAFRETGDRPEPVSASAQAAEVDAEELETSLPTYRTVESVPSRRAGGPIVDIETGLASSIVPVESEPEATAPEAGEPDEARTAEVETWRRTAMAELNALATDSDDLMPRRRR